nr:hypothetical protein [uncultured Cellulosilyticum sp.]
MIICDNCQAEISDTQLKKKFGDIEITYLYCEECCSEYLISVTDSKLRKMIEAEKEVQEKIKLLHKAANGEYKLCNKQKQKNRVLKQTQKSQNKLMKKYKGIKEESNKYHEELKKMYE